MPQLIIRKKSCNYQIVPFTDNLRIGRDSDNELVLDSPQISRHHAKIEQREKDFYLIDCKSTNGIWLGKEKIKTCRLENGLTFKIFDYFFTFTLDTPSSHVRMDRQQHAQEEKTIVFGLESFLPEPPENIKDIPVANRLTADLLTNMRQLEQIDSEPDLYDNLLLCAIRFFMCGSGFIATRDRNGKLIYRSTHNLTPSGTEVVAGIPPEGLKKDNSVITKEVDDTEYRAEVADLNKVDSPEIYVLN